MDDCHRAETRNICKTFDAIVTIALTVLVIQEHAKLVSRFVNSGMDEIHKPYTIPKVDDEDE